MASNEPKITEESPKTPSPSPPIDFKTLFELQENHKEFNRKFRVNRFLFSVLCGAWFHLLYNNFFLRACSYETFIVFDFIFVALHLFHEKLNYTRPINVRALVSKH